MNGLPLTPTDNNKGSNQPFLLVEHPLEYPDRDQHRMGQEPAQGRQVEILQPHPQHKAHAQHFIPLEGESQD